MHTRPASGAYTLAFCLWEGREFYDYYQITAGDADDGAEEFGADAGSELKNRTEGSHSIFGIIWSIQKETGWTREHILWHESWLNIQLGIADSPKTVRGSDNAKEIDDANDILELFE